MSSNARELAGYASSLPNFRNRIINGDMRIDQRNAGSAVTGLTGGGYTIDRWTAFQNYGTVTIQQSAIAPSGFSNSFYATVTSASSAGASSIYTIVQKIEGSNVADLNFGSLAAKTITISFQVRSSVTGTYGVFIRNNAEDRYYASTFYISSANTFEPKTITISGDTAGTWDTSTGTGLTLGIVLGAGADRQGTANSWTGSSSGPYTTSSQVDWMSNSGATFYITGVQLEEGTVATPFEHRPISVELSLCQRYCYKHLSAEWGYAASYLGTGYARTRIDFKVQMRASPSISGVVFTSTDNPNSVGGQFMSPTSVTLTANPNLSSSMEFSSGWIAQAEL